MKSLMIKLEGVNTSELSGKLVEEFKDKDYAHAYADEVLNAFIATQIKVLREKLIGTQEQLADLAGMKQERISVLENVNYSSWSINTLRKLAKAFDLYLKVSFENFTDAIHDMDNFEESNFVRTPRDKELAALKEQAKTINSTGAAYNIDKRMVTSVRAFTTKPSAIYKSEIMLTGTEEFVNDTHALTTRIPKQLPSYVAYLN